MAAAHSASPVTHAVQALNIKKTLNQFFGIFPQVKTVLEKIDSMYQSIGSSLEPENLFIVGEPGVGKSRILTRVREQRRRIDHGTYIEIPVLYTSVPAKSNIESLASAMLLEMGSPFWDKGKEKQLTHQLKTLIRECKVRLIILDEVNHLVDKGGVKTHHLIADWIKQLSDETRVPIILAGIPRAKRLLDTNDQLRSRFREVLTIHPFSVENELHAKATCKVMRTFEDRLNGLKCISLGDAATAQAFVFATAGRLRDIRRLLVRAVELALKEETPSVSLSTLACAFREVIYPDAPDERNPFTRKFTKTPLTMPGEPFAPREE